MDWDGLAKIIWDKPLSEVEDAAAAKVAKQYPYFAAGQFLHLQKLTADTAAYQKQYQKAILYYHNPTSFGLFINYPQNGQFEHDDAHAVENASIIDEVGSDEHEGFNRQREVNELPVKAMDKTAATEEEPLLFEPFHTVDYFASQGIKPTVDEVPNDKFGKQLKSFTDWLKTMKKISAADIAKDTGTEKNVENLAAHSVEDASVITESMAEVWMKQGNNEKAIDTYRKLSLQNPAKSAYFAAKIESINRQK